MHEIYPVKRKFNCTLNSVTGNGHIKHQENSLSMLSCKLHGNTAWKMYLLLSLTLGDRTSFQWWPQIPIIWHVFTWPVILSFVDGILTIIKPGKWSYKSKKWDWPCILHGHSQSHYWKCVIVALNKRKKQVTDCTGWWKFVIISKTLIDYHKRIWYSI